MGRTTSSWGERRGSSAATLFSFSGPPEALPRERLSGAHRDVLGAWHARRAGRRAAPRAALEPAAFPRALPHVLLWEPAGDDYRCRLSGSAVDEAFGGSLRGTALCAMACPDLPLALREFAAVRDLGHASFAERTLGWLGKPHLAYRHLLLPLCDEAGVVHQLLGVLTFDRAPLPAASARWQAREVAASA